MKFSFDYTLKFGDGSEMQCRFECLRENIIEAAQGAQQIAEIMQRQTGATSATVTGVWEERNES